MMDRGSFKNAPYNITNKDRMKQLREAERMMEPRKESPYSEEDRAEMDRMFQEQEPIKKAKGGMVKKVRGYAEGGSVNKMRSESTEAAKAGRSAKDAVSKLIDAESAAEKAQYLARNIGGEDYSANARVTKALAKSAQRNKDLAADEAERVSKETGYSSLIGRTRSPVDGSQERLDESPVGVENGRLKYAKGGLVKKGKGSFIQVRGQGKARSKPCKCC